MPRHVRTAGDVDGYRVRFEQLRQRVPLESKGGLVCLAHTEESRTWIRKDGFEWQQDDSPRLVSHGTKLRYIVVAYRMSTAMIPPISAAWNSQKRHSNICTNARMRTGAANRRIVGAQPGMIGMSG